MPFRGAHQLALVRHQRYGSLLCLAGDCNISTLMSPVTANVEALGKTAVTSASCAPGIDKAQKFCGWYDVMKATCVLSKVRSDFKLVSTTTGNDRVMTVSNTQGMMKKHPPCAWGV